jgi:hypothetical protein
MRKLAGNKSLIDIIVAHDENNRPAGRRLPWPYIDTIGRATAPIPENSAESIFKAPALPDRCAPLFPSPFAPRLNEGAHGVIVGEFHRAPADAGHYRTARPGRRLARNQCTKLCTANAVNLGRCEKPL